MKYRNEVLSCVLDSSDKCAGFVKCINRKNTGIKFHDMMDPTKIVNTAINNRSCLVAPQEKH